MSKKIDSLMNLFLKDSYSEFNLREVARLSKLNPMTVSKYLNRFVKDGILKKKSERNYILFSANTESIAFKDMKRAYNVSKIRSSGLIGFLEKELHPEVIILFGSFSKAENHAESDIDMFIITESRKKPDTSPFEKNLAAEIQLFIHSRKEFERMKKTNIELLNNVLNGTIISGVLEVFK